MTQEEKILLLKDLSARLSYGVVLKVNYIINNETTDGEDVSATCDDKLLRINFDNFSVYTEWLWEYSDIDDVKPYLRPLSSITEDESYEYQKFINEEKDEITKFCNQMIFYNKHHIDYRGLIEKGLALEAPENMYKICE